MAYSECSKIVNDDDDDDNDDDNDGNKHEGFRNRLIYRHLAIGSYF